MTTSQPHPSTPPHASTVHDTLLPHREVIHSRSPKWNEFSLHPWGSGSSCLCGLCHVDKLRWIVSGAKLMEYSRQTGPSSSPLRMAPLAVQPAATESGPRNNQQGSFQFIINARKSPGSLSPTPLSNTSTCVISNLAAIGGQVGVVT